MMINVDLGETLEGYVETLVGDGRYPSRDALLREAVRLVQEREQRLAHLDDAIEAGLASARAGDLIDADEVFDELERRYSDPHLDTEAA